MNVKTKEFVKWCKENKRELESFVDIKFNTCGFDWLLNYKISFKHLDNKQKLLSEEFTMRLKELDGEY